MRFADKMAELTTCDGCGGECNDASGFCQECQSPEWEQSR